MYSNDLSTFVYHARTRFFTFPFSTISTFAKAVSRLLGAAFTQSINPGIFSLKNSRHHSHRLTVILRVLRRFAGSFTKVACRQSLRIFSPVNTYSQLRERKSLNLPISKPVAQKISRKFENRTKLEKFILIDCIIVLENSYAPPFKNFRSQK